MRSLQASISFVLSAAVGAMAGLAAAGGSAWAEDCPGNPDSLGTSRILVLKPGELARVGVMQYPQSLPLADKEVVLTFDDGPLPRYSNPILDILAAQCVKATYFLVGEMARAYPAAVRRIHEAGHTIGTHTEDHPLRMHKLPVEKVRQEIDQGIADVSAALWDAKDLAPFFRIPGFDRSDVIESEAAARSLVVFGSDTVADDWHRRIKPADIVNRAMSRLEARGKGILLLHDIHAATLAALPDLLKKLKAAGFHVVHVVPGTADQVVAAKAPPETAGEPTPPVDRSEPDWPTLARPPIVDQVDVASAPQLLDRNEPDSAAPPSADQPEIANAAPPRDSNASDQPASVAPASDPPARYRGDPDWPTAIAVPETDAIELPAPDENTFATDYRPWRTVILADGSEAAKYLALNAVTQWADPPAAPVASDQPALPAPAIPDYFGGGETATSIAE
jgi:peptidoglycan/xylan/chitin deacetylase (PgdA/CDA1 family)